MLIWSESFNSSYAPIKRPVRMLPSWVLKRFKWIGLCVNVQAAQWEETTHDMLQPLEKNPNDFFLKQNPRNPIKSVSLWGVTSTQHPLCPIAPAATLWVMMSGTQERYFWQDRTEPMARDTVSTPFTRHAPELYALRHPCPLCGLFGRMFCILLKKGEKYDIFSKWCLEINPYHRIHTNPIPVHKQSAAGRFELEGRKCAGE